MYARYVKRYIDMVLSFVGLVLLFPIFIVVAGCVLVSDGRPVFFLQQRVGRNRKSFNILKFRTMTVDKSSSLGSFDAGSGARVTRIGGVLRRYKIDELPQLFNVLKGDMSIIGPRPEVSRWTQVYADKWNYVLTVRPGITDWAALMFRNEEDILAVAEHPENTYENQILPRKLEFYREYVSNINFVTDMNILLKTIGLMTVKRS